MKKIAPHLPPRVCFIKLHEALKLLKPTLIVIAVGVAAGVLGAIITSAWIMPPNFYPQNQDFSVTNPKKGEEAPKNINEEQELRIRSSIVSVYPSGYKPVRHVYDAFEKKNAVGAGVFITTDGWILLPEEVFKKAGGAKAVFFGRGSILEVVRALTDPVAHASFVKVKGDSFPVVQIDSSMDFVDSKLYLITAIGTFENSYGIKWKGQSGDDAHILRDSNVIYRWPYADFPGLSYWNDPAVQKQVLGAPVANIKGELTGLVLERSGESHLRILPISLVQGIFSKVFLAEGIERDIPGFKYAYAAHMNWLEKDVRLNRVTQGAIITAVPPASEAIGFEVGDVVIEIDGVKIKNGIDIGLMLASLVGRDYVRMKILRDGGEAEIMVQL